MSASLNAWDIVLPYPDAFHIECDTISGNAFMICRFEYKVVS